MVFVKKQVLEIVSGCYSKEYIGIYWNNELDYVGIIVEYVGIMEKQEKRDK